MFCFRRQLEIGLSCSFIRSVFYFITSIQKKPKGGIAGFFVSNILKIMRQHLPPRTSSAERQALLDAFSGVDQLPEKWTSREDFLSWSYLMFEKQENGFFVNSITIRHYSKEFVGGTKLSSLRQLQNLKSIELSQLGQLTGTFSFEHLSPTVESIIVQDCGLTIEVDPSTLGQFVPNLAVLQLRGRELSESPYHLRSTRFLASSSTAATKKEEAGAADEFPPGTVRLKNLDFTLLPWRLTELVLEDAVAPGVGAAELTKNSVNRERDQQASFFARLKNNLALGTLGSALGTILSDDEPASSSSDDDDDDDGDGDSDLKVPAGEERNSRNIISLSHLPSQVKVFSLSFRKPQPRVEYVLDLARLPLPMYRQRPIYGRNHRLRSSNEAKLPWNWVGSVALKFANE